VIEDNRNLATGLRNNLEIEGYTVDVAVDGASGLAAARASSPDLIILDLMLPEMDGYRVLRTLREEGVDTPVLILSARGEEADKVLGFHLGADDYVPKPFSPRELLARLRAVMRRAQPAASGAEIVLGRLAIDVGARQVRVGSEPADLTGLEFDILLALARRPGRVVPRETLLGEAGRQDVTVSDRTVDVHVSHLRRKLGDDPKTPRLIKTVRGVGYVLSPEAARDAGGGA
jgi:DNA-binding response OmpR family regulator